MLTRSVDWRAREVERERERDGERESLSMHAACIAPYKERQSYMFGCHGDKREPGREIFFPGREFLSTFLKGNIFFPTSSFLGLQGCTKNKDGNDVNVRSHVTFAPLFHPLILIGGGGGKRARESDRVRESERAREIILVRITGIYKK